MSVKSLVTALAVIGGAGLAPTAHAAPIAPSGILAGARVETVAYGCGPGFIPNRFGYCRPYGYGYGRPRPFHGPRYGYHRPPFGPFL